MSTHVFSDENKGKGAAEPYEADPQQHLKFTGASEGTNEQAGKGKGKAAATATKSNQSTTDNGDDGDDESNSGAYICPHCGKKYTREPNLKRHVRVNHGTGDRPFACPSCSHTDARKDNLKKHMKKAHGADWGLALYDAAVGISSDESSEEIGEASGTGGRKDEEDGENSQK